MQPTSRTPGRVSCAEVNPGVRGEALPAPHLRGWSPPTVDDEIGRLERLPVRGSYTDAPDTATGVLPDNQVVRPVEGNVGNAGELTGGRAAATDEAWRVEHGPTRGAHAGAVDA